MASIDFTKQWTLDLRLVIQNKGKKDKVLYANTEVMSSWSPVFKAMLKEGSLMESETKEVKLPEKKYEVVLELLQILHPSDKKSSVTLENAYKLLPLVHEYQMQTLVDECEEAIMKTTATFANLKLAEDYGLQKLRDHSLTKVATYTPLYDIQEDGIYKGLSESTKMEVLLKKITVMEDTLIESSGIEDLKRALNEHSKRRCGKHMTHFAVVGHGSSCDRSRKDCQRKMIKSFYERAFFEK